MLGLLALAASVLTGVHGFDNSRHDNLAVYWGQNSYGAVNSGDTANWQKTLSYYCNDNSVNAIPIAFITSFSSTGGEPSMNLANICNDKDNATFPGTDLPNCSALASQITACQASGKILTISLGGANTNNVLASDADAQAFADQLWNLFLGGSSSTRPFGSAVLDGVDIDVESGAPNSAFPALVNRLRTHFSGASKTYYVTAAPQCPYPDSNLQTALNGAPFDAVYVQFYNNQCGLQNYGNAADWDFGLWDYWATHVSPNKNVRIYIGAPAASGAGGGYQPASTLVSIATQMRKNFPSFGGVMLWDASQAWANGNYQDTIKAGLTAAGGTGFTYPACNAACVSGQVYTQGQQCSQSGYIWQAKWWTQSSPTASSNSDWMPVSSCGGAAVVSTTTTTPATNATTTPNNSTVCANVAPWSSTTVYVAPNQVTYTNELWTAKWWTQGDTPGGAAGAWQLDGSCAVSAARARRTIQTPAPERRAMDTSYWRTGMGRRAGMGRLFDWNN